MTFILTVVGLFVFVVSCFTATFKVAFKRLAIFAITGVVLDCLIGTIAFLFLILLSR